LSTERKGEGGDTARISWMIFDSSEDGVREGRFFVNWACEDMVLRKKKRLGRYLRLEERSIWGGGGAL